MRSVKLFISVFLLIFCRGAFSTSRQNFPELISVNEGLSQSFVNCIFQDSRGYLWIGTFDGLNRYDGRHFEIFRSSADDSRSLSDSYITSVTEDYEGNIWVGTRNGLNRFLTREGIFQRYHFSDSAFQYGEGNIILNLMPSGDKSILIKTEHFLQRFFYEENRHVTYQFPVENQGVARSTQTTSALFIGRDKKIFAGYRGGLMIFGTDSLSGSITILHASSAVKNITSIAGDPDGNILLGCSDGLYRLDTITFEPVRYTPNGLRTPRFMSDNILGLYVGRDGKLWMGTSRGFLCYDPADGSRYSYNRITYLGSTVELNNVKTIIGDRNGNIWFSTWNGIAKLLPGKKNFKLYNRNDNSIPALSGLNITALLTDSKNRIWVASWDNGIDVIDRRTHSIVAHYSKDSRSERYRLMIGTVNDIYEDRRGRIWLASERGLYFSDPSTGKFVSFDEYLSPGTTMLDNLTVFQACEDRKGNLMIATSGGAYFYEPDTGKMMMFRSIRGDENTLPDNYVTCVHHDRNGYYWFGTESGLTRWDPSSGRMLHYGTSVTDPVHRLTSDLVTCMVEDSVGFLWVGTMKGLNRIELSSGDVNVYTKEHGLPVEYIYAIIPDERGRLWMSTHEGLVRYDTSSGSFLSFDTSDGLQSLEFNQNVSCKAADGEIFFGGVMGFNSFYPDSVVLNLQPPLVQISYVDLIRKGRRERIYPSAQGTLVIRPGVTSFTIAFSAMDFTDPARNQYEYILQGVDKEWVRSGNVNTASYARLPYGRYRFMVRGSNNCQVWSTDPVTLGVVVRSSILGTRIAIGAYVIAFLFIAYASIRYRTATLRRANQLLRDKEQAADEINRQKEELSIKNRNITDSIIYAQKIQEAMLPSMNLFRQIFPNSFILFKPKDIVSGDFYWINKKGDKVFVAAVDCTGHGVPGALMSMIGSELIRNIINVQNVEEPAQILDRLNKGIADSFNKEVEKITLKDGMDLSLCSIDMKRGILEFAGAFNSGYLVRDETITELKADRVSVGLTQSQQVQTFTNLTIPLEKNDIIYMFTDGYADQFGGPREKKFMYRRFRHLLLTIHKLTLDQQKTILEETIENWMGKVDQIDDILVIGFKPLSSS